MADKHKKRCSTLGKWDPTSCKLKPPHVTTACLLNGKGRKEGEKEGEKKIWQFQVLMRIQSN